MTTYDKKEFPVEDVLSITTGRLVTTDINAIYKILNFMLGANIYTHQIPYAINVCRPQLFDQFPQLHDIDVSSLSSDTLKGWLAHQRTALGESLTVRSLGRVHDQGEGE